MSYEPNEWQSGDTVTAAHLNRIEQGIAEAAESGGGGLLLIDYTLSDGGSDDVVA